MTIINTYMSLLVIIREKKLSNQFSKRLIIMQYRYLRCRWSAFAQSTHLNRNTLPITTNRQNMIFFFFFGLSIRLFFFFIIGINKSNINIHRQLFAHKNINKIIPLIFDGFKRFRYPILFYKDDNIP